MHYSVGYQNPNSHFIDIDFIFEPKGEPKITLNLPAWRPGRYELGNFAKNIQRMQAFSGSKELSLKKITKDSWEIETEGADEIKISYNYFANELNAGSTYLDAEQLYVNGVNCLLYISDRQEEECSLSIDVPENYQIACGLSKVTSNFLEAKDFHELVDSPFIASANIKHHDFETAGVRFHLWFQGECKPDFQQLERDFRPFCEYQVKLFGELPCEDYHFMFQVLPYRAYHGVEHANSTVCLLGPSYDIFNKNGMYLELLGVSSHELFHAWNVKRIRPIEMWPFYDYSKENYSKLGYLAEGVTTFYGDWMLLRSGVFSEEEFNITFQQLLDRHFNNPGVLNMSVADASFDLWLDGYVPGVPNRKSSIYVEGALVTFLLDIIIRKNSNSKYSFDDVIKEFYSSYFLQNKGISEEDYKKVVERFADKDLDRFFRNYVNGSEDITELLRESLDFLGLELKKNHAVFYAESYYGIKAVFDQQKYKVLSVYPNSPAEKAGLSVDDEIITVNGFTFNNDLDRWMEYFLGEEISVVVKRKYGKVEELQMISTKALQYANYSIQKQENANAEQKENYKKWCQ